MTNSTFKKVLATVAVCLLVGLPGLADPKPLKGTPKSNVQTAIQFINDMGDPATAKKLTKALENGQLQMDRLEDANAEVDHMTVGASTLTLDHMAVNSTKPWKLDNLSNFVKLMSLAKTLCHEQLHLDQGGTYVALSNANDVGGDNSAELEGWSRGMQVLQKWTDHYISRGDSSVLSRTVQEKIDNYKRASMLCDLILNDLREFKGMGYGELRPPYPHKTAADFKK